MFSPADCRLQSRRRPPSPTSPVHRPHTGALRLKTSATEVWSRHTAASPHCSPVTNLPSQELERLRGEPEPCWIPGCRSSTSRPRSSFTQALMLHGKDANPSQMQTLHGASGEGSGQPLPPGPQPAKLLPGTLRPGAPGGRAPSPTQETSTRPPHHPLPWALGFHRLHPFRNSAIRFCCNKSTRVNQAAAVKGHNSRETCPASSASALRGISNVIQILSPLALHLFIYALGQQWPKSLLRSDSCLVVCATRHGAAGRSSCLQCPSSPQAPQIKAGGHARLLHTWGPFLTTSMQWESWPHTDKVSSGPWGSMVKPSAGPGGLHWPPPSPGWEAQGSVTATQTLSELTEHQRWGHPGPTFIENGNRCE